MSGVLRLKGPARSFDLNAFIRHTKTANEELHQAEFLNSDACIAFVYIGLFELLSKLFENICREVFGKWQSVVFLQLSKHARQVLGHVSSVVAKTQRQRSKHVKCVSICSEHTFEMFRMFPKRSRNLVGREINRNLNTPHTLRKAS